MTTAAMAISLRKFFVSIGIVSIACTFPDGVSLDAQVFTKPAPVEKKKASPPAPRKKNGEPRASTPPRANQVQVREPSPFVGSVPRAMIGQWGLTAKSGALQSTFLSGIEIEGGEIGTVIGKVTYWLLSPGRDPSQSCQGSLTLSAVEGQTLVLDERVGAKDLFCPGDKTIRMQLTSDKLYVEWSRKRKDQKVTMQGWATRVSPSNR